MSQFGVENRFFSRCPQRTGPGNLSLFMPDNARGKRIQPLVTLYQKRSTLAKPICIINYKLRAWRRKVTHVDALTLT